MIAQQTLFVSGWRYLNSAGPMAVREQLHMAVQLGNKQGADTQQMTDQPEHLNAQPMLPAVSIMEVVHQAPRLMELLTPEGVKALTATCTQLRQDFRHRVTTIRMTNEQDQAMLFADKWPSLVMVVIDTTVNVEEQLSGNRFMPYLPEKEWATMVRFQVEESLVNPSNGMPGCKQSVALIVTATHQSSQDMNAKVYGIALARLATEWVAKTRRMFVFLRSESAYMNPFKYLHMGDWPCLERIICHGHYGNTLPVSCFWGDSTSNLQIAIMSQCSLDVEAVQSLVTTCPHLYHLSLTACKLEAAALTCLSQARFLSLEKLDLSQKSLGLSGVQSLSSCDLPALQRLILNDSNLSALAAMHLAQGCWPNLTHMDIFDNQLNVEAVAYLIKGKWPLLQELGLSWTCVPEAAFAVLGVVDACKQFENKTSCNRLHYMPVSLLRSGFLVWPRLKALTVRDAIESNVNKRYML